MLDVSRRGDLDDVIGDSDDLFAVPDDHNGGTGAGAFHDGLKHPGLGCDV
jgi:hypothetical protein